LFAENKILVFSFEEGLQALLSSLALLVIRHAEREKVPLFLSLVLKIRNFYGTNTRVDDIKLLLFTIRDYEKRARELL